MIRFALLVTLGAWPSILHAQEAPVTGSEDAAPAAPAPDPRTPKAIEAARAGRIDLARSLLRGLQAGSSDVEHAIHDLPVPDLQIHEMARSGQMELRKFWGEWRGVLDGSRALDLEIAEYAKAIQHEKLCDDMFDSNPFHRKKCDEFVQDLRRAIDEGFRRRWIVQELYAGATYDIKKERWTIFGSGFKMSHPPPTWFLSTPTVCAIGFGSDCYAFCGKSQVDLRTTLKMSAAQAEPIADSFPKGMKARAVLAWVSTGSRRMPACTTFREPYQSHFEIFRVAGIEIADSDGKVYTATGVFK